MELQTTLTARPRNITTAEERSQNIFCRDWGKREWYAYFRAIGAEPDYAEMAALEQVGLKQ